MGQKTHQSPALQRLSGSQEARGGFTASLPSPHPATWTIVVGQPRRSLGKNDGWSFRFFLKAVINRQQPTRPAMLALGRERKNKSISLSKEKMSLVLRTVCGPAIHRFDSWRTNFDVSNTNPTQLLSQPGSNASSCLDLFLSEALQSQDKSRYHIPTLRRTTWQ
ncbi:hypothetical protein VTO42DRAFT_6820 [Malbranchea cinnamomea]